MLMPSILLLELMVMEREKILEKTMSAALNVPEIKKINSSTIATGFQMSLFLLAAVIAMAPARAQAGPTPSAACQWMYSSGGAANFRNLAVGPPLDGLRFGDFDGDGKTDVFATVPQGGSADQWKFSSGGAVNFRNLAVGPPLDGLRFGDFDGDGKTDVFAVACG
jgi:hypothetical protein